MGTVYVPERQVEYWTSRQIEEALLNAGYWVMVLPIEQRLERHLPADHLISSDLKLFGLQYKALYCGPKGDYWSLRQRQHDDLRQFEWIYYGLSDLKSVREQRSSLHALRIKTSDFPYVQELAPASAFPYMRWYPFYMRLKRCFSGTKVESPRDADQLLDPLRDVVASRDLAGLIDAFVIDLEARTAVRLSSSLRFDGDEGRE